MEGFESRPPSHLLTLNPANPPSLAQDRGFSQRQQDQKQFFKDMTEAQIARKQEIKSVEAQQAQIQDQYELHLAKVCCSLMLIVFVLLLLAFSRINPLSLSLPSDLFNTSPHTQHTQQTALDLSSRQAQSAANAAREAALYNLSVAEQRRTDERERKLKEQEQNLSEIMSTVRGPLLSQRFDDALPTDRTVGK